MRHTFSDDGWSWHDWKETIVLEEKVFRGIKKFDTWSLLSLTFRYDSSFCLAAETIVLAFQNYIVMLGTSVMVPSLLVPAMGGSDVSCFSWKLIALYFCGQFWLIFLHSVKYLIKEKHFLVHKQGDKARVIQTLLFVAGIKTLLQALFGTRLPAVVGGSFAYVVPIAYIINDSKFHRITDNHEVSN